MDMQVNPQLIRNERLKRAWSQEHLAQVSGLGIRTVQRIESGGNASLETLKALAAVLELPVEALLADMPALSSPPPLPSSRFRLFKPWPAFAAGCAATVITLGSLFMMQGAVAQQIAMEFALKLNGDEVSVSRMTSQNGDPAVVEVAESLKVNIVPRIRDGNFVLLSAEIYAIDDGRQRLISSPSMLIEDGNPAMFRIGDTAGFEGQAAGEMLELLITPTIE